MQRMSFFDKRIESDKAHTRYGKLLMKQLIQLKPQLVSKLVGVFDRGGTTRDYIRAENELQSLSQLLCARHLTSTTIFLPQN